MLTELRNAKLRPDGRAGCSPPSCRCGRGSEGEPPEPALPASFHSRCSRCPPCAGCGTGPCGNESGSLLYPWSGLLGLGACGRASTREAAAGQRGCRLFSLVVPLLALRHSGWETAGRAFFLLFYPLGSFPRAKGGAAGVRPDGAVGVSGAARGGGAAGAR